MNQRQYIPLERGPLNHRPWNENIPEGAQVFVCDNCAEHRMFGVGNMVPDNQRPLLICRGRCGKYVLQHTPHTFAGVVMFDGTIRFPRDKKDPRP